MSEFVHKDEIFQVPTNEITLLLSPAFDVIHRFKYFGANILKYWDSETKGMLEIIMEEEAVNYLIDFAGLPVVDRPFMTHSEHEKWLDYKSESLEETFDAQ
jgi:hypothetical protein